MNRYNRFDMVRLIQPDESSDELSEQLCKAQVRMYRGQLVQERRDGCLNQDALYSLISVPCTIKERYKYLPFEDILKNNRNLELKLIEDTMNDLLQRADILLCQKDDRPPMWKIIKLQNTLISSNIQTVKGSMQLLNMLGYVENINCTDELYFSENSCLTEEALQQFALDARLAIEELRLLKINRHPNPAAIRLILNFLDPPNLPPIQDSENRQTPKSTYSVVGSGSHNFSECETCGTQATQLCPSCGAKNRCDKCDSVWHSHRDRKSHQRFPLHLNSNKGIVEAAEKEVKKPIVPPKPLTYVVAPDPSRSYVSHMTRGEDSMPYSVDHYRNKTPQQLLTNTTSQPEFLEVYDEIESTNDQILAALQHTSEPISQSNMSNTLKNSFDSKDPYEEIPETNTMINEVDNITTPPPLPPRRFNGSVVQDLERSVDSPEVKLNLIQSHLKQLEEDVSSLELNIQHLINDYDDFETLPQYLNDTRRKDKFRKEIAELQRLRKKILNEQLSSNSSVRYPPRTQLEKSGISKLIDTNVMSDSDSDSYKSAVDDSGQIIVAQTSSVEHDKTHENNSSSPIFPRISFVKMDKPTISSSEVFTPITQTTVEYDKTNETNCSTEMVSHINSVKVVKPTISKSVLSVPDYLTLSSSEHIVAHTSHVETETILEKDKWQCQHCTYLNEISVLPVCQMCCRTSHNVNAMGKDKEKSSPEPHASVKQPDQQQLDSKNLHLERQRHAQYLLTTGRRMIEIMRIFERLNVDYRCVEEAANNFSTGSLDESRLLLWVKEELLAKRCPTVMQLATKLASKQSVPTACDPLQFSFEEAQEALFSARCDSHLAAEICLNNRLEEVARLSKLFPSLDKKSIHDTVYWRFSCGFDEEKVFMALNQKILNFSMPHLRKDDKQLSQKDVLTSPIGELIVKRSKDFHLCAAVESSRDKLTRCAFVEFGLKTWPQAELLIALVAEFGEQLVLKEDEKMENSCVLTVDDLRTAAINCADFANAQSYLHQTCETCYCYAPRHKMLTTPACSCQICRPCYIQYFTLEIRNQRNSDMCCPMCSAPEDTNANRGLGEENSNEYYSLLVNQLRELLPTRDVELFERKLCEKSLMQLPDFRWCSHCACGFVYAHAANLCMQCPSCCKFTCFKCKKPWEEQHRGLTCEAFQDWKEKNDPQYQAEGLARHLRDHGIDCPKCNFKYALARGGCMHFKCVQCRHEFCCGCRQPFRRGAACQSGFAECAKLGLHCHHPRSCLFYLRDMEKSALMKLLKDAGIPFNSGGDAVSTACVVIEQKETVNGLSDEACGGEVAEGQAGLCLNHYKEYLVGLINRAEVDPVSVMTMDELIVVFCRVKLDAPQRGDQETEVGFTNRLRALVKERIPLN